MTRYIFAFVIAVILGFGCIKGQTLYSVPSPLQENSKDVKVYFNASGTKLEGLSPASKIYAHTAYEKNENGNEWIEAPQWGNNADKYLLTNQGDDLWMLYIGDIRTYYNVPSGTNVKKLDFVFRTSDTKNQTENLYLNVYDEGLQLSLISDSKGNIITGETGYVVFTVNTTEAADITLTVDGETIATVTNETSLEQDYTFTKTGEHLVVAKATAGEVTVSEEMTFFYLSTSNQMDYPGGKPKMGQVRNPDGSVTFCLGAPEKNHVVLLGSWNNFEYSPEQVMNYQETDNGKYFWTTITGLDDDKMYTYYYVIDGGEYMVGDPYAKLILDPYNDNEKLTGAYPNLPEYPVDAVNGQNIPIAVYQGSFNEYDWKVENFVGPSPSDLIIYELLLRDFTGTEGKALGNGTVRQAIDKFDYLLELGVNAIELMPIMEFSGNQSWGYNPNFYFAVDKAYGTQKDYKEFIDLCHQNGIAVILDMVFNQSDGLHPWYQMYGSNQNNPFYNYGFGGENGSPHAYSVLNDWNQGMPMVQEQWKDVIEYWMTEFKFDGFRFDLVKGLGLNSSYSNASDAATDKYNESRVAEMQYLQDVILSVNPNSYCINENLAGAQEENEMAETGMLNWANVNDPGCQFAMGYPSGSNLNRMYAPDYTTYVATTSSNASEGRLWGSTVSYLESHDEQRLAYKQDQWGVVGVKGNVKASMQRLGSAAAQMLMTPGAHMIWQFSEMGNAENTKNNDGGNNVSPKIVNWGLLDEPNHMGLYKTYCDLISIRRENPELFSEKASFDNNCGENDWNKGRWLYSYTESGEIFTLINPNVNENLIISDVPFKSKDNSSYKILACSYESNPSFDASKGTVTVPANCFVTIGSLNIEAAVDDVLSGNTSDSLRVYGGEGEVIVEYAVNTAEVYSIEGRMVGKTVTGGRLRVPSGMYIVKSGNNSVKVMVQ